MICKQLFSKLTDSTVLKVHSVFEKTINLWDDEHIVACMALAPLPMGITCTKLPTCTTEDTIVLKKSAFSSDDVIDYTYVPAALADHHVLVHRSQLLVNILSDTNSLFTALFCGSGGFAVDFIRNDVCAFLKNPTRQTAAPLIGYGAGLTPSCDDFLRGWSMVSLGLGDPFCFDNFGHTTAVSIFLQQSVNDGLLDPIGSRCVHALLDDDSVDFDSAVADMLKLGSTSGADCVWGMTARLIHWLKIDILNLS